MSAAHGPIALVGLPGAGKTTVAAELAGRLGWQCADLDAEIAVTTGRSPNTLIRAEGEAAFREQERNALGRVLAGPRETVIACGGGVLTDPDSRRQLSGATLIWLDAPDQVLLGRVGSAADRPLLTGDPQARLAQLRREREEGYASALLRVSTDQPVEGTIGAISAGLAALVPVRTPSALYPVLVQPGALGTAAAYVPPRAGRVALVVDQAVRGASRRLASQLRRDGRRVTVIGVSGGERLKTWGAAGRLLARLNAAGIRRSDCVVAMGGGATGDLAGFAAATHLRGVAWVNVPTTLMAMVDSAVGGKTGVNLPRGKNLAGAIWQPRAVVCDPELLESLPARQFRAALAEVVKYAMVFEGDIAALLARSLTALLARDPAVLLEVIRQSCAVKAEVVGADEREAGSRALLNYGHTTGHALEAAAGYGTLSHGEAVAVGMRVAGLLSLRVLGCPEADITWQDETLAACGLGRAPRLSVQRVLRGMRADKKQVGDGIGWVLIEARGRARYGQPVAEDQMEQALRAVLPP